MANPLTQAAVSGLMDSSTVGRVTECINNDVVVTEPQQMNTPTTEATEATDMTSKVGGRPCGITVGANNAQTTLVAEALDKCAIEIASIKYTAAEKAHRRGNGKK
jgi:hypothetical protein